ncbi:MAG TPA: tryptophan-rich sensory protein [Chlamydiales bacterium]|nr:tryptophan-rich sensory protein [Chlamydiales bacterium]
MKKLFSSKLFILMYCLSGIILVQLFGSLFSIHDECWYHCLKKPPLVPPSYAFGIIWPVLYLSIALALWLLIIKQTKKRKTTAYIFFGLQLYFNFLWTFLFFGLESPLLALINVFLLDIFLILSMIAIYPISKISFSLLIPYLLWVLFATYLNFGFLLMN